MDPKEGTIIETEGADGSRPSKVAKLQDKMEDEEDSSCPSGDAPLFTKELAKFHLELLFHRIALGLRDYCTYNDNAEIKMAVKSVMIWLRQFPDLANQQYCWRDSSKCSELPLVFFFKAKAPLKMMQDIYALFPDPNLNFGIGDDMLEEMLDDYCDDMTRDKRKDFILFMCQSLPAVFCEWMELDDEEKIDYVYLISQSTELCLLHDAIRQKLLKNRREKPEEFLNFDSDLVNLALLSKCPDDVLKLLPIQKFYGDNFQVLLNFDFDDVEVEIKFTTMAKTDECLLGLRDALFATKNDGICGCLMEAVSTISRKPWCQQMSSASLWIDCDSVTETDLESVSRFLQSCDVQDVRLSDTTGSISRPIYQSWVKAVENRPAPLQHFIFKHYIPYESAMSLIGSRNGAKNLKIQVESSSNPWGPCPYVLQSCVSDLKITFDSGPTTLANLESVFHGIAQLPHLQHLTIKGHPGRRRHKVFDISAAVCTILGNAKNLSSLKLSCPSMVVDPAKVYDVLKDNTGVKAYFVNQKDQSIAECLLVDMLKNSNRTLTRAWVGRNGNDGSDRENPTKTSGEDPICYYLTLNHLGRKELVDSGLSKKDFIGVLHRAMSFCTAADERDYTKEVRYSFGLLLENPNLWAS